MSQISLQINKLSMYQVQVFYCITFLFTYPTSCQNSHTLAKKTSLTVGENLRNIRKERGLKQYQLAVKVGVHRTVITKWEKSDSSFSIRTLRRLATALDVIVVDLLKEYCQLFKIPSAPEPLEIAENLDRPLTLWCSGPVIAWPIKHPSLSTFFYVDNACVLT